MPIVMKNTNNGAIKEIQKLEQELKNECAKRNRNKIGGFLIMFDDERGRTIEFVEKMTLECTGCMKERYDKDSEDFNPEYRDIGWPYTGFVQGNMMGWYPIPIPRLAEWLTKYGYELDEFVESFRSDPA